MKNLASFSVLFAALAIVSSGCASAPPARSGAGTPALARTDTDRYSEALAEAARRYEAELELSVALSYRTDAEARAVARTHAPARFGWLLEVALERRGLSARGLRVHARRHPELTRRWEQTRAEVAQLQPLVARIEGRVEPRPPLLVAFDSTEADGRVARRD